MTQKIFSISILLVSLTFLTLLGCGSDEEKPEKPIEPEPILINEDLLGSWDVVSINDEHPLAFINADEPDEEDRPQINIEKFTYDFDKEGSWKLNLEAEMVDFPEDPAKEGKVEITGMWSGTYTIQDSHLSLNTKEKDLNFRSVPEDFFEKIADVTEIVAQRELIEKFNSHLFTPFAKTFITIDEKTLTFEPAGSERKMILEKQ